MYESQILAIKKYREINREKINEREREKYKKLKEGNEEKFKLRIKNISDRAKQKSREKTQIRREIKSLMRINI